MNDIENLQGAWCVFPKAGQGGREMNDAVRIYRVEEMGAVFGGIPYIRFQADHDRSRIIELYGVWSVLQDGRA